jgi:hypothetical protein
MIQRVLATFGLVMLLSGCYVDSMDDRPPAAPGFELDGQEQGLNKSAQGECRFMGMSRGCLDGYIVVNDLSVGGKAFHNADVLANQFHDLIAVERRGSGTSLAEGEEFELNLLSSLSNKTFSRGFEYYVSGDALVDGAIRKNHFTINGLREGTYDIRIEKKLKFEVLYTDTTKDDEGNEVEEDMQDIYCASIYSDDDFEVTRGTRSVISFKEFSLHLTNDVCEKSTETGSIIIP